MTIAGQIRAGSYAGELRRRAESYAAVQDDQTRFAAQLAAWNREWRRLTRMVPYYRLLREQRKVPTQFSSWEEFAALMPIATRGGLQQHKREMTSLGRAPDCSRVTGGSTAEPVQLPAWNSELKFTRSDMWLGRSWYGISPASRLFLLWGHSHLLGSGMRGWLNGCKRQFSDWLVGYHRCSSYDLRPEALRRAAEALLRFQPDYVIGYSMALALFAHTNQDRRAALRALGLKAVVGAAECFPAGDSVALLEDLFACPVAMEYGSVETNLIAHTRPQGNYSVFWRTYFLEAERTSDLSSAWKVRVTGLYPRCFPLVRYELGDEIELIGAEGRHVLGVATFKRVIGRCNDYVVLKDGAVIHSESFTHAVRSCPGIRSYQVVDLGSKVVLNYTSEGLLSEADVAAVRGRLAKIHAELANVELERVFELRRTMAGKTRMVVQSEPMAAAPHPS